MIQKIVDAVKAKQSDLWGYKPITVAFLGDSVTQGCFEVYTFGANQLDTIFEPGSGYVSRFEQIFHTVYPKVPLNVVNAGISGGWAQNGLTRLERDILSSNPDIVVVGFALNDCCQGYDHLPIYLESLKNIFEKCKAAGAEVVCLTPNNMCINVSPFIKEEFIVNLAKDFVNKVEQGVLDKFVEEEVKLAKECGVTVCDVYAKWKALEKAGANTTELLSNKLNHPSREMCYVAAWTLFETIFM